MRKYGLLDGREKLTGYVCIGRTPNKCKEWLKRELEEMGHTQVEVYSVKLHHVYMPNILGIRVNGEPYARNFIDEPFYIGYATYSPKHEYE